MIEPCIATVHTDDIGLSSAIWILGEFGESIRNASYIIENIIDNFQTVQTLQPNIIIYNVVNFFYF